MQEQAGSADTNLAQPVRPAFTRVRPQQVYIISREKRRGIKIGISVNPRARLSGLQIAASERLTLERTFQPKNKVASAVEAEFKSLLAPLRMQGEWFSISADFAAVVVEAIIEDCAIKRAFVSRFIEYELAEDECGYPLGNPESSRGSSFGFGCCPPGEIIPPRPAVLSPGSLGFSGSPSGFCGFGFGFGSLMVAPFVDAPRSRSAGVHAGR